ncbi:MAG: hypothetical protein ACREAY_01235 [Nitrososphaera sp.]|uniref:hypothetical protein n=1 Tax=Nitrososphaera sp. TaxID=1971748 RepID=UPI003D6EC9E1
MSEKESFEKLNKRKEHYRTIDDDTILSLKEYYKIDDHDELLKYVKKTGIKGDNLDEKATTKDSIA